MFKECCEHGAALHSQIKLIKLCHLACCCLQTHLMANPWAQLQLHLVASLQLPQLEAASQMHTGNRTSSVEEAHHVQHHHVKSNSSAGACLPPCPSKHIQSADQQLFKQ